MQEAFHEVANARVARRWYEDQIAIQQAAQAAEARLASPAHLRYANGISPYLQVPDAERSLFLTQQDLIRLRATSLQNAVSLWAALGGGSLAADPNDPLKSRAASITPIP